MFRCQFYRQLSAIGHMGRHIYLGYFSFSQDGTALFYVSAVQTGDNRNLQAYNLRRFHNTTGNDIALVDAAEDIYENTVYLVIRLHDAKSFSNLFYGAVAAYIQEVGRLATVKLNDI